MVVSERCRQRLVCRCEMVHALLCDAVVTTALHGPVLARDACTLPHACHACVWAHGKRRRSCQRATPVAPQKAAAKFREREERPCCRAAARGRPECGVVWRAIASTNLTIVGWGGTGQGPGPLAEQTPGRDAVSGVPIAKSAAEVSSSGAVEQRRQKQGQSRLVSIALPRRLREVLPPSAFVCA